MKPITNQIQPASGERTIPPASRPANSPVNPGLDLHGSRIGKPTRPSGRLSTMWQRLIDAITESGLRLKKFPQRREHISLEGWGEGKSL